MSRLHQLHRWTGIIAGPLLILIAFSGAALLFRQDVERAAPRTVAAAGRAPLDIDELARRVTASHPGSRISYVQFPGEAGAPFEIVLLHEGSSALFLAVDPYTGSGLGPVQERNDLMSWAGRLHSSLFLGQIGRRLAVVLSVVQAAMIFSGLLLSLRGRLSWHGRLGWAAGIPILLYSLSGFLLLAVRPAVAPPPPTSRMHERTIGEYLAAARQAVSGLSPAWISLSDPVAIRFRRPDDLQKKGSNDLFLDPATAQVLRVNLIEKESLIMRLHRSLAALHFGETGGARFRPLYAVCALFPFLLWLSGLSGRRNGKALSTHGHAGTSTESPPRVVE